MELLRFGPIGHYIPVVCDNDVYYDLASPDYRHHPRVLC